MSADPIVYCLEQLTDYRQFERLCSDIMAGSGYPDLEPLGGSNDRGRDAIHVSNDAASEMTVFAFSVRSDWERKLLAEDCKRIQEEGHSLNKLVFACTSNISASKKDAAKERVVQKFGWTLELYDIERIRVALAGNLRHLVAQHPTIFCPPWFPVRGGLSIAESRDTLVIDHNEVDHAFATWLTRRLQVAGYRTWCFGTAPLGGEDADATVRVLIEKRAAHYLPVLSEEACEDNDLTGRCGAGYGADGFLIPCWAGAVNADSLSSRLRAITPVRFDQGWASGLESLLRQLEVGNTPKSLDLARGREVALRSYAPEPVTHAVAEDLYSNVFKATVPPSVIVSKLERELTGSELTGLRVRWGFAVANATTLLSFHSPPDDVPVVKSGRSPEYAWSAFPTLEGCRTIDAVKELVRRCLDVACSEAGLVWCDDRKKWYFPQLEKPQRNVSYRHVDGRNTWVGVTGEKSYGKRDRAEPFRYQLAPLFRVGQDEEGEFWITTRIYVRITDCDGIPHKKKAITKRRKVVTRSWWNKEWLARTLAVMQALSDGGAEIEMGSNSRRLAISTEPLSWSSPISINLAALERVGDFQDEMAATRYVEAEEDDEDADDVALDAENSADPVDQEGDHSVGKESGDA